ncbi:ATP-binding protein [Amycolatopsis magusensis]|uniref:Anti-sigma regulatory factor (Ser/Thr protein kinase) n=1 Tax=Amycolatopsis magusensis TaxID=882444 RepID=A0ABS4Q0G0_9PSEU|nr:ATP-binding protein [Amycolatopsis magusensis]MBP2185053.1 anti-sigma regulatory factor (Ser/Thr protein kinase) [Amycolatopsis magusensis]
MARPAGKLDSAGLPRLRDTLLGCAADHPAALVVVLDELAADGPGRLGVLTQVRLQLADWPGIPLLLAAATPPGDDLPAPVVHPSVTDALARVRPAPRRQASIDLPPVSASTRLARNFVRTLCRNWAVEPRRAGDARMVTSELVENVLVHTDTPALLRCDLREDALSIAVADGSPVPARLREGRAGYLGGLGLKLVAQLTTRWGCSPTLTGGKVVWAVFSGR